MFRSISNVLTVLDEGNGITTLAAFKDCKFDDIVFPPAYRGMRTRTHPSGVDMLSVVVVVVRWLQGHTSRRPEEAKGNGKGDRRPL